MVIKPFRPRRGGLSLIITVECYSVLMYHFCSFLMFCRFSCLIYFNRNRFTSILLLFLQKFHWASANKVRLIHRKAILTLRSSSSNFGTRRGGLPLIITVEYNSVLMYPFCSFLLFVDSVVSFTSTETSSRRFYSRFFRRFTGHQMNESNYFPSRLYIFFACSNFT